MMRVSHGRRVSIRRGEALKTESNFGEENDKNIRFE